MSRVSSRAKSRGIPWGIPWGTDENEDNRKGGGCKMKELKARTLPMEANKSNLKFS